MPAISPPSSLGQRPTPRISDNITSEVRHGRNGVQPLTLQRRSRLAHAKFTGQLKKYQLEDVETIGSLEATRNTSSSDADHLGFILAYQMGLGKTVVSIDVICRSCDAARREEMATLVICPNYSLLEQWAREFQKFSEGCRVLVYHANTRGHVPLTSEQLKRYDVVLATYHQVHKQYVQFCDNPNQQGTACPFFCRPWYRGVLDEPHCIGRQDMKKGGKLVQAILSLQKKHGLCLSGTPIQNAPADLFPQLRFLNLTFPALVKLRTSTTLSSLYDREFTEQSTNVTRRFSDIFNEICIHRTNTQADRVQLVPLPDIHLFTNQVKLSARERELYRLVKDTYATLSTFARVMRERQASVMPSLMRNAAVKNNDAEDPTEEEIEEGIRISSGHADQEDEAVLVSRTMLVFDSLSPRLAVLLEPLYVSSKIREAMKIISRYSKRQPDAGPPNKIIVFSWFKETLELIGQELAKRKTGYELFNGKTPCRERTRILQRIADPDSGSTVLLMSIQAGGQGLNLTSCNIVILLEPWWNPSIEDQAIGRAWRIGQERPVRVHRLISKDTIEEQQMLEIQATKKAGVEAVLSRIKKS